MSHPIPENRPNLAPIRPEDGPQDGEVLDLPTYDESEGLN